MYSYVTLVMKYQHYINGALALAYSLRLTKTKHKIVCMLTKDLINYKNILLKIFDDVIIIPYLQYNTPKLKTKKQNDIYGGWKDISFTKWNCLNMKYTKICFLDADLIIQKNIDHLFNLHSPAGCFGNNWCSMVDYYSNIYHGSIIPKNSIKRGLEDGYIVNGHCIILEPTCDLYTRFVKFMNSSNYIKNPQCISMVDEVALVKFMRTENKYWTQIGKEYNSIPWKNGTDAFILHYFNIRKPWIMNRGEWPDLKIWYDIWDKLCIEFPDIKLIK